jgi:hypothetical protein
LVAITIITLLKSSDTPLTFQQQPAGDSGPQKSSSIQSLVQRAEALGATFTTSQVRFQGTVVMHADDGKPSAAVIATANAMDDSRVLFQDRMPALVATVKEIRAAVVTVGKPETSVVSAGTAKAGSDDSGVSGKDVVLRTSAAADDVKGTRVAAAEIPSAASAARASFSGKDVVLRPIIEVATTAVDPTHSRTALDPAALQVASTFPLLVADEKNAAADQKRASGPAASAFPEGLRAASLAMEAEQDLKSGNARAADKTRDQRTTHSTAVHLLVETLFLAAASAAAAAAAAAAALLLRSGKGLALLTPSHALRRREGKLGERP